jgi:hypothetical protein
MGERSKHRFVRVAQGLRRQIGQTYSSHRRGYLAHALNDDKHAATANEAVDASGMDKETAVSGDFDPVARPGPKRRS